MLLVARGRRGRDLLIPVEYAREPLDVDRAAVMVFFVRERPRLLLLEIGIIRFENIFILFIFQILGVVANEHT